MARVFSLPTVLRQVPKPLLGRFFNGLGVSFPGVDWAALGERDVQPILTVLNGLPNAEMVPVENELRTVFEMACDAGLNALTETAAALGDHDLAERTPQDQTAYGRAMWVWLQEHDSEGRLAPRAVRRTFSIVFAYDREDGTLELFAKVPGKFKPRLEELFARHVLDADLGAWQPPAAFALNHLRLRSTSLPVARPTRSRCGSSGCGSRCRGRSGGSSWRPTPRAGRATSTP